MTLLATLTGTDVALLPAALLLGGGWLAAVFLLAIVALLGIRGAAIGLLIYAAAVIAILSN